MFVINLIKVFPVIVTKWKLIHEIRLNLVYLNFFYYALDDLFSLYYVAINSMIIIMIITIIIINIVIINLLYHNYHYSN